VTIAGRAERVAVARVRRGLADGTSRADAGHQRTWLSGDLRRVEGGAPVADVPSVEPVGHGRANGVEPGGQAA
jgi:hypothetical protein